MPFFARRIGRDCTYCHTLIPKLNEMGRTFRSNGYRFTAEEEWQDVRDWQTVPVSVEAEVEESMGAAELEPEVALSMQQLQYNVAEALDALPHAQRTVVNLVYYHGMGYEEIAAIMDCPVNTVKTRMFTARTRLRDLLADQMEYSQ